MRALVWDRGTIYGTSVFGGEGSGVGNGTVWSYIAVPEPSTRVGVVLAAAVAGLVPRRRTAPRPRRTPPRET